MNICKYIYMYNIPNFFCTNRYQKVTRRNSYTVQLSRGPHKYGCIQCYITVSAEDKIHHVTVISPLNIMPFTSLPWLPDENSAIQAAVSQVAIHVQSVFTVMKYTWHSLGHKNVQTYRASTVIPLIICNTIFCTILMQPPSTGT